MNNLTQFTELMQSFTTAPTNTTLTQVLINVVLLIFMTSFLGVIYVRSSYSLSNRKRLAIMFPVLALTTMMIISIIQNSLALSLGLVGALSIIRFRAAIKEPEELVYIFLMVSLGLGFGAQQRGVTVLFFVLISIVLVGRLLLQRKVRFFSFLNPKSDDVLYLDISQTPKDGNTALNLENISQQIQPHCTAADLKRIDDTPDEQQYLFEIKVSSPEALEQLQQTLRSQYPAARISLLQHESLFA